MDINTELSPNDLQKYQKENKNRFILVKLGATWCGPCKKISPLCNKYFDLLPSNVDVYDIDVDDELDLYMALKRKKMLSGIPALYMWECGIEERDMNHWFIPDDSVSGSDENEVSQFFKRCIEKATSSLTIPENTKPSEQT